MKLNVLITFIISIVFLNANSQDSTNTTALQLIEYKELIKTVEFLTSKELAGRMSGSDGYNKAADFIASEFKAIDLVPKGEKGYFQYFNIDYNQILSPCEIVLFDDNKNEITYKLGEDFVCRGFSGSGKFTSDIVFCGYGQTLPESNYDDYSEVDVKDKIVLIFKQNPTWKVDDINWKYEYAREKANLVRLKGAKGVIFVSKPNDKKPQKPIGSLLAGKGEQIEDLPQVHVQIPVANKILSYAGASLENLQSKIDSTRQPSSFNTNALMSFNINARYFKEKQTMNVIGMIEGSDEMLKNEYIIISAHLDHVGEQGGEIYFPGANDDASGSAAVLEIARTYAKAGIKPKRSILFVLFACEENGLDGANYMAKNLSITKENIVAMLNMDCIAFGDSIQLGSGKTSPNLWKLAKTIDRDNFRMTIDKTWGGGGADATPFYEIGIPTLYFVTTNSYEHLHYMTDLPETLNLKLFETITKLAFLTSYQIAIGNYSREEMIEK